ncbi:hypothetical protein LCGC14_0492780 [marine sediment metagenome]|uniref:Major facilitator superfamily (MFS) profile domain-containing protein n=1 Tax=marine sediment metagenome TaxID=412755 RepID=A0A0F9S648_9ZZZZ
MVFSRIRIYFGFFLIYSIIGIFDAFLVIYIPLFYLNILNVNRSELAFIQALTYTTLFASPLLGFLYDKYVNKEIQGKILLNASSIILCGSFLIFILLKEFLIMYGVFVVIYFFSKTLIKTGMSSLFLTVVKESKSTKLTIILLVNTATIVSYFGISLLFNFNLLNITSQNYWNIFFTIGWISSLPIIIVFLIFNNKIDLLNLGKNNKNTIISNSKFDTRNYETLIIIIMYFSYVLAASDLIISFPLSSWIYEKFNETGFRIYSSMYIIFNLCSILGLYFSNLLCKKFNEKKIMFVLINLYMVVLFLITISNFPIFIILNSCLSFIGYAITVAYSSFITDFSNKGKYNNFKYQFLQTYHSLAAIIFVPIGTLSTNFLRVETLMSISCILNGISGLFILSTNLLEKKFSSKKYFERV